MQNLSSVSMLCKLNYCFNLLNRDNLLLGRMPSCAFFFQVLIAVNKAIVNIGKDRENLSILTDYDVVPLLIDLVNTVRVTFYLSELFILPETFLRCSHFS